MQKAFKYRLYPTKKQERTLFWTLTRCRELYRSGRDALRSTFRLVKQHQRRGCTEWISEEHP